MQFCFVFTNRYEYWLTLSLNNPINKLYVASSLWVCITFHRECRHVKIKCSEQVNAFPLCCTSCQPIWSYSDQVIWMGEHTRHLSIIVQQHRCKHVFCVFKEHVWYVFPVPLQVHPPCRFVSRTHHQHHLPRAAGNSQRALRPLAAHWQRLPAQDGIGARPWVTFLHLQSRKKLPHPFSPIVCPQGLSTNSLN